MVEQADTLLRGGSARKFVGVRIPSSAPKKLIIKVKEIQSAQADIFLLSIVKSTKYKYNISTT